MLCVAILLYNVLGYFKCVVLFDSAATNKNHVVVVFVSSPLSHRMYVCV